MRYLIDTSVLVRSFHSGDPRRPAALGAILALSASGNELCILPQNVAEFWAVCTRSAGPPSNGLGMSKRTAQRLIRRFEPLFTMVYETPEVYTEWRRLLDAHDVSGRAVHDVRLVAAALANGLDFILTFDFNHFQQFSEVQLAHPAIIASEAGI